MLGEWLIITILTIGEPPKVSQIGPYKDHAACERAIKDTRISISKPNTEVKMRCSAKKEVGDV